MTARPALGLGSAGLNARDLEALDCAGDLIAEAWTGIRTARHEKRPPSRETVAMLLEATAIALRVCERHAADEACLTAIEAWQGRQKC